MLRIRWQASPPERHNAMRPRTWTVLASVLLSLLVAAASADDADEIRTKAAAQPIKVTGELIHSWPDGPTRIITLRKGSRIEQGGLLLTADNMVLWFDEPEAQQSGLVKIRTYAESATAFVLGKEVKRCEQFFGEFQSEAGLVLNGQVLSHAHPRKSPLVERADKVRALGQPEYMSLVKVPADVVTPPKPPPSEGVQIRADSFDTWEEKDGTRVVVLKGNVNIIRGEYELAADRVVLWFSNVGGEGKGDVKGTFREVYAEGDVVLYQDDDTLRAQKVFQDRIENKGMLEDARITARTDTRDMPIIVGGKEIRQIDEDRFEVEKGFITTDDFGKPHFRFQSQRIRLIESKNSRVVNATHNTFRLGDLPVFYWPFLSKDIKDDSWLIKRVRVGSSSEFGTFVLTDWDFYDFGLYRNDWSDVTLEMDFYDKRGAAFGFDIEYRRKNYFGYVDTYYIHDSAELDRPGYPVPEDDRGRALWRHRHFLPKGFRLDAEVSWLSDRNFLREYFEEEYQTEKEQETMVYLRKLFDNKGLTVTEKHRINRFQTTTEQTPRIRFDVIGEPVAIGDTYLNYTGKNEVSHLRRRFSNVLGLEQPPEAWRLYQNHELRMPLRFSKIKLDPFVSGELTYYDNTLGSQGSRHRGVGAVGIDASTQMWRIYDIRNKLLDINRVRHIVTPEIRYETIYSAEPGPWNYTQFDYIDRMDQIQHLVAGARTRFQTKRGPAGDERTVDWLNIDLEYNAFLGNAGANKLYHDFVEMDFTCQVNDRIVFDSKGNEINLGTGEMDIFNAGVQFSYSPRWQLYVGHRYVDTDPSRQVQGQSVAILSAGYIFNEKWSGEISHQYDYKESANLSTRVILTRQLPAWILQMVFELDEGEDDTIATINLSPAGLKEGLLQF